LGRPHVLNAAPVMAAVGGRAREVLVELP
jgi:hypothetical protein